MKNILVLIVCLGFISCSSLEESSWPIPGHVPDTRTSQVEKDYPSVNVSQNEDEYFSGTIRFKDAWGRMNIIFIEDGKINHWDIERDWDYEGSLIP